MEDDLSDTALMRRATVSRTVLRSLLAITAGGALLLAWSRFPSFGSAPPASEALGLRNWIEWAGQSASSLATIVALFQLLRSAGSGACGEILPNHLGSGLRAFARWMFIAAACRAVSQLAYLAITRSIVAPPVVRLDVSGSDLMLLVASAALYEVAGLLDYAHRVSSEYRQIV